MAYAPEVRASLSVVSMESAIECSHGMMAAVGALVEMRGILRFIQRVAFGLCLVQRENGTVISNAQKLEDPWSVVPRASTLWLTCKTLLQHRCWRRFPSLAQRITDRD